MAFKFNNGDRVRCFVTGFEGIVTGRADYLNGCVSYCVKPRVGDDKKMPEGAWLDEPQLELIAASAVERATGDLRVVGGPRPDQAPER